MTTGQRLPKDQDLITIFNQCFLSTENTELRGNASEPLYTPARNGQPAIIDYRNDYFASALHEIAHWCIAGVERRQLEDYGYWYEPDGRTEHQQRLFETVEVKPQALEWIFSRCCQTPFFISADNLSTDTGASENFKVAVYQQVVVYLEKGLPTRAKDFATALSRFYRTGQLPVISEFLPPN